MASQLSLPSFFDPANARAWAYRPNLQQVFEEATAFRKRHHVKASAASRPRVHLVGIDAQKDFCFPEGTLYVAGRSGTGAMDDSARLASFIYREVDVITDITMTMDTHFAYQIFFPAFWVTEAGEPLAPHSLIDLDPSGRMINVSLAGAVLHANIRPNPAMAAWLGGDYAWLCKQAQYYVEELKRAGKYTLYLWPFHCILGTDGHALAGVIAEARMFHAFLRGAQSHCEVKGGNPLTENYSVLRPEVLGRWDGKGALAQKNTAFIERLMRDDIVAFAGQAASHCVKSSIEDFLGEIVAVDPALARKVYVLEDCMSAVTVPDGKGGFVVDFTPQAQAALDAFRKAGMHVVSSTTPIAQWPGVTL
ncbi:MAG: nicotinamidase [bacterium]|nr:nicotinamidase [bacterium]